ncbi:hypothetical protein OG897_05945 [Streptomyces sp. NBC_00237]|uniref:hypothetical protein n=1 Tax=Streptomyces sp. NBC_00237 TaxID=2975687 RepID=UPI00225A3C74|nr:hypothetical protein [Streptomyces sp. NBC_00237]MCX5201003.1 hypothetical protein [Streptomyces sp. NBC_00237]
MTVGRAWRILLAICGGAVLLGIALLRLHTQLTGTPGFFTAASCVVSDSSDKDDPAYECVGSFAPTNGTFHIPYLEVDTTFPAPPREPVAVFVDEGDTDTAVVTGNEAWLPQGLAGLVLLPAGIFMAVRAAQSGPRP